MSTTSDTSQRVYYAGRLQMLAVTILGSVSAMYTAWWPALANGFGYFIIFSCISAASFFIYCCCMSELTSTFPFPGGTYALARLTVGFYPGFLVGCAEIFYYMLLISIYNNVISETIIVVWPVTADHRAEIVTLIFVVELGICLSKRIFWSFITLVAFGALAINVTYLFGAIKYFDFEMWGYSHPGFDYTRKKTLFYGTDLEVVRILPISTYMFFGMEIVSLMCDEVRNPRRQIPFGQTIGAFFMCCLNVVIPVVTISMFPGTDFLATLSVPLVIGLSVVYKLSLFHALSLQMVGLCGGATYGVYALSKLLAAMAEAKLLPPVLAMKNIGNPWCRLNQEVRPQGVVSRPEPVDETSQENESFFALCFGDCTVPCRGNVANGGVPILSTLLASILAALAYVVYYERSGERMAFTVAGTVCICCTFVYAVQLIGFITMRLKLSQFHRDFRSPFGVVGAIFSLFWFLLAFTLELFVRPEGKYTAAVMSVWFVVCTAYYFFIGRHSQVFSEAERTVILPAHAEIKNANGTYLF
jgi:ethanolamine permease